MATTTADTTSEVTRIVLQQRFPLGRFHATPWGVNPFDDPYGEWPPSPWRLARAITARFYQWQREAPDSPPQRDIDELLGALARASFSFALPGAARPGPAVRQYHRIKFAMHPSAEKGKRITREMGYKTTLFPDNSWIVPADEDVTWVIDLDRPLEQPALDLLDRCLERMTYFGRAESITEIQRVDGPVVGDVMSLSSDRSSDYPVPVLVPAADATREEIEATTGSKKVKAQTVPPGARWMYAQRRSPTPLREPRRRPAPRTTQWVQFALGVAVPPPRHAIVHLTNRFRANVVTELIDSHPEWWTAKARRRRQEHPRCRLNWSAVRPEARQGLALILGKDADGKPLEGRQHTQWVVSFNAKGRPSRLVAWRATPFREDELRALLRAGNRDISWARAGRGADAWQVRLVPLDEGVAPPPGFDGRHHDEWVSATPFVPPRHWFRRDGSIRESERPEAQLVRELNRRGLPAPIDVSPVSHDGASGEWVSVHRPHSQRRRGQHDAGGGERTVGMKRGFRFRIRFSGPVSGPIMVGHSATFGLGLFVPAAADSQ